LARDVPARPNAISPVTAAQVDRTNSTGRLPVVFIRVNGRILARFIPDSTLRVIPGGGHLFVLENPAAIAREVADFLAAAPATLR
jgi:pimeloyl-ACP methyl ester carboxylesterase